MKKNPVNQLFIDFDNSDVSNNEGLPEGASPRASHKPFVFPKHDTGLPLLQNLSVCLGEIQKYLAHYPLTLSSFIFNHFFFLGKPINEFKDTEVTGLKIPSGERIRQIAVSIAMSLGYGRSCPMLYGIRLSESVSREIKELRESQVGMYIDSSLVTTLHAYRLQGIAHLLSMRVVEPSTVVPTLSDIFFISENKSIDVFRNHYRLLTQIMQDEVRPQSAQQLFSALADKMGSDKLDTSLALLALKDHSVFDVCTGDDGTPLYMIKFKYLKVYQQMARLVYEMKSASINAIAEELRARGSDPKAMSLSLTSKRFPWVVPMGKSLWIYREDGQKMARIQDVIKDYCEQHVRFSYDEILLHLHSLQYDMPEKSLRNYITKYCRRRNEDKKLFCLTSMIPPEEDHLWFRKSKPTTRRRKIAYHVKLLDKIAKIIKKSPNGYVPRKTVRTQVAPFLEKNNVKFNIFYKIVSTSDRFVYEVIDGETCIKLANRK